MFLNCGKGKQGGTEERNLEWLRRPQHIFQIYSLLVEETELLYSTY